MTRDHVVRTGELALRVGERFRLSGTELRELALAAMLHDVGKLHTPDEILKKPASLTAAEYEVIKLHPVHGEEMLASEPTLARAARIVRHHHERMDGRGYPDGLVGHEIPLASRIIAACDALDAMTHDRQYRTAMPVKLAFAILREHAGSQWDPAVVEQVIAVLPTMPTVSQLDEVGRGTNVRTTRRETGPERHQRDRRHRVARDRRRRDLTRATSSASRWSPAWPRGTSVPRVTRATTEPTTSAASAAGTASRRRVLTVGLATLGLVAAACGGGDDASDATTTTTPGGRGCHHHRSRAHHDAGPHHVGADLGRVVTEGATVVVANASGINGAAGRSQRAVGGRRVRHGRGDELGRHGEQPGDDPDLLRPVGRGRARRRRVAQAGPRGRRDRGARGRRCRRLTASGELGEASVLVLMGDDVADKTLDELQGTTPAPSTGDDDTGDDTGDDDTATTTPVTTTPVTTPATTTRPAESVRRGRSVLVDQLADASEQHLDRGPVESALGHDHVGVTLARFDEALVARPHGRQVLIEDALGGAAALGHVAPEAADDAQVGGRVDEDLQVEALTERGSHSTRIPSTTTTLPAGTVSQRSERSWIA
jgi:hypothetical protein